MRDYSVQLVSVDREPAVADPEEVVACRDARQAAECCAIDLHTANRRGKEFDPSFDWADYAFDVTEAGTGKVERVVVRASMAVAVKSTVEMKR